MGNLSLFIFKKIILKHSKILKFYNHKTLNCVVEKTVKLEVEDEVVLLMVMMILGGTVFTTVNLEIEDDNDQMINIKILFC